MKRNARLLNKTAKRIEKIPRSYRQTTYCESDNRAPCGTVACLAGEIIICSEPTVEKGIAKLKRIMQRWGNSTGNSPRVRAMKLAGLTRDEANRLFPESVDEWPDPFRSHYRKGRARAAVNLLRYLAKGGEV